MERKVFGKKVKNTLEGFLTNFNLYQHENLFGNPLQQNIGKDAKIVAV